VNLFYNFIYYPTEALYKLSRKEHVNYRGYWILLLAVISTAAGFSVVSAGASIYSFTWGVLFRMTVFTFIIFVSTVFYHYFAGVFGGYGEGSRLFKVFPYTYIHFCFIAPLALILKAFAAKYAVIFLSLVLLVFLIKAVFLQVRAISYIYSLSRSSSAAVILFPWLIIGGIMLALPLLGAVSIFMRFL